MLDVTREGARNQMRKVRPKPKRAGKRKREARKKGKPRGSWAWRLFVHYNCRGKRMTKEVAAELSEQYRNLSEEEFKWYVEMAKTAADIARAGARPLGPKEPHLRCAGSCRMLVDYIGDRASASSDGLGEAGGGDAHGGNGRWPPRR